MKLFPYKIHMQQLIGKTSNSCGPFQHVLEENSATVHRTWFTDEAYFHLKGYISKQNIQMYVTENLHEIIPQNM
jgi:hypothetical protein